MLHVADTGPHRRGAIHHKVLGPHP
jgi:hypothetical protein